VPFEVEEDDMPARSTLMRIHNLTANTLTKTDASLDHGDWTDPNEPPDVIPPGETRFVESESAGIATGTEGAIRYDSDGGGSFYFHWDNPYLGVNSYAQGAPDGCGVAFSGGKGNNAELDVEIIPSARVAIPDFEPSSKGFRFGNHWPDEPLRRFIKMPDPFGDITIGNASNGLCGGMVYAVADYYLANMEPPRSATNPPGTGDPLFDYLVSRLFDSFDLPAGPLTYWKYMDPVYPDTPRVDAEGRSWVMAHEGFPAVMTAIAMGQPCPLGLVMIKSLLPTDLGHNHQVLAYAYQLDGGQATIWVYDPNSPSRDDITLSFDLSDPSNEIAVTHNVNVPGRPPVYAFFPTAYAPLHPPWLHAPDIVSAVSSVPGGVSLFLVDPNGAVQTSYYDPRVAAPEWSPWAQLSDAGKAPGGAVVSAVSSVPGGVSLFLVDPDGAVQTSYYDPRVAAPAWSPWARLSDVGKAPGGAVVTAVSSVPGGVSLFLVDPDGAVQTSFYDPRVALPAWSEWARLSDAGKAPGGGGAVVSAVSSVPGGISLFLVDPDGAVQTSYYDPRVAAPAWSEWARLSDAGMAPGGAVVSAVSSVPGGISLFLVDADGAVQTSFYDPRVAAPAWSEWARLSDAGKAPGGAVVSAVSSVPGGVSLFLVDPDGAVQTSFYDPRVAAPAWSGWGSVS